MEAVRGWQPHSSRPSGDSTSLREPQEPNRPPPNSPARSPSAAPAGRDRGSTHPEKVAPVLQGQPHAADRPNAEVAGVRSATRSSAPSGAPRTSREEPEGRMGLEASGRFTEETPSGRRSKRSPGLRFRVRGPTRQWGTVGATAASEVSPGAPGPKLKAPRRGGTRALRGGVANVGHDRRLVEVPRAREARNPSSPLRWRAPGPAGFGSQRRDRSGGPSRSVRRDPRSKSCTPLRGEIRAEGPRREPLRASHRAAVLAFGAPPGGEGEQLRIGAARREVW